jgi:hypothetical protein
MQAHEHHGGICQCQTINKMETINASRSDVRSKTRLCEQKYFKEVVLGYTRSRQ